MEGRDIYIISDWHWTNPACSLAATDRVLDRAEEDDALILDAGDLFDCWYRDVEHIREVYHSRIQRIQKRLFFKVAGNHDSAVLHVQPVLSPTSYPFRAVMVDGRVWYVEHGHLIGKWACLFKKLDEYDEKWWFRKVGRWVIKQDFLSEAGRKYDDPEFKFAAIRKAKLKGATVVVIGHNHIQEIYRDVTGQMEVTYVNPGTALGDRCTYIVYRHKERDFCRKFAW